MSRPVKASIDMSTPESTIVRRRCRLAPVGGGQSQCLWPRPGKGWNFERRITFTTLKALKSWSKARPSRKVAAWIYPLRCVTALHYGDTATGKSR
jgi:hypothetical protein